MKLRIYRAAAALALFAGGTIQIGATALQAQAAGAGSHTVTVHIKEVSNKYGFHPTKLTVTAGTKVTWVNNSDAPHTVTGTGSWKYASKTFSQNGHVTTVFNKAGTYHYICSIHRYMKATVVVK